jgi:hypothetical protein
MFFNTNTISGFTSDTSLASLIMLNSANTECRPNYPDLGCPIWDVKIIFDFPDDKIECSIGGLYDCNF